MASSSAFTTDCSDYPTRLDFDMEVTKYLAGLGTKKAAKSLVTPQLYTLISSVLTNPLSTRNGTAQERHWIKREFKFSDDGTEILHNKKKWRGPLPRLARKGEIYDVIREAHEKLNHRGRDKTFEIIKKLFSHIPKELVARFIRVCPTCETRNAAQGRGRSASPKLEDYEQAGEADIEMTGECSFEPKSEDFDDGEPFFFNVEQEREAALPTPPAHLGFPSTFPAFFNLPSLPEFFSNGSLPFPSALLSTHSSAVFQPHPPHPSDAVVPTSHTSSSAPSSSSSSPPPLTDDASTTSSPYLSSDCDAFISHSAASASELEDELDAYFYSTTGVTAPTSSTSSASHDPCVKGEVDDSEWLNFIDESQFGPSKEELREVEAERKEKKRKLDSAVVEGSSTTTPKRLRVLEMLGEGEPESRYNTRRALRRRCSL